MSIKIKARQWLSSPANRFVFTLFSIYAGWKLVYHFLLQGIWRAEWKHYTDAIGTMYAATVDQILHLIGEHTTHYGIVVAFMGSGRSIRVEEHCDAIPAMILFACSIAFFPGSWKNKSWYIPMGLAVIIVINLIRLVLTCYAFEHFSQFYFQLHHSFVYVIITYGAILGMIRIWMNRYSDK